MIPYIIHQAGFSRSSCTLLEDGKEPRLQIKLQVHSTSTNLGQWSAGSLLTLKGKSKLNLTFDIQNKSKRILPQSATPGNSHICPVFGRLGLQELGRVRETGLVGLSKSQTSCDSESILPESKVPNIVGKCRIVNSGFQLVCSQVQIYLFNLLFLKYVAVVPRNMGCRWSFISEPTINAAIVKQEDDEKWRCACRRERA